MWRWGRRGERKRVGERGWEDEVRRWRKREVENQSKKEDKSIQVLMKSE